MPAGAPSQLATATAQSWGQTSASLNLGSGIAAGTLVTIVAYANNGYPGTVTDDHGNEYVADVETNRIGVAWVSVWRFFYAAAPGATTVTVSLPSSPNITFHRAWAESGMDANPLDLTASDQNFSAAPSVDTSPAETAQADEAVLVALGGDSAGGPTWPPAGYVSLGTQTNSVRNDNVSYAYKLPGAIGAQSAATTYSASEQWSFVLATYKAAGAQSLTLAVGRVTSPAAVHGVGLAAPAVMAAGKVASSRSVRGAQLAPAGPVALTAGKVQSQAVVRGADVAVPGGGGEIARDFDWQDGTDLGGWKACQCKDGHQYGAVPVPAGWADALAGLDWLGYAEVHGDGTAAGSDNWVQGTPDDPSDDSVRALYLSDNQIDPAPLTNGRHYFYRSGFGLLGNDLNPTSVLLNEIHQPNSLPGIAPYAFNWDGDGTLSFRIATGDLTDTGWSYYEPEIELGPIENTALVQFILEIKCSEGNDGEVRLWLDKTGQGVFDLANPTVERVGIPTAQFDSDNDIRNVPYYHECGLYPSLGVHPGVIDGKMEAVHLGVWRRLTFNDALNATPLSASSAPSGVTLTPGKVPSPAQARGATLDNGDTGGGDPLFLGERAFFDGVLNVGGKTVDVPVVGDCTAGSRLIANVVLNNNTLMTSVTDDRGNVWAVDAEDHSVQGTSVFTLSAQMDDPLLNGEAVHFAWDTSAQAQAFSLEEWANVGAPDVVQGVAHTTGVGTAMDSGLTSGAVAGLVNAVFGMGAQAGNSATAGPGFQPYPTGFSMCGGSTTRSFFQQYQVADVAEQQDATATQTQSQRWQAVVTVYPATGTGTPSELEVQPGIVEGARAVRGVLLDPGTVTLPVGRLAGRRTTRGVQLEAGTATVTVGRVAGGRTTRGADLAAKVAAARPGKVQGQADVRGVALSAQTAALAVAKPSGRRRVYGANVGAGAIAVHVAHVPSPRVVRAADVNGSGTTSLPVSRVETAQAVHGSSLAPAGFAPLSPASIAGRRTVRGVTLTPTSGVVAAGKVPGRRVVHGPDVQPGTVTLPVGHVVSTRSMRGANVATAGAATLPAGKVESQAETHGVFLKGGGRVQPRKLTGARAARGVALAGAGTATLNVGAAPSKATLRRVELRPGTVTLPVGRATSSTRVRGADVAPGMVRLAVGSVESRRQVRPIAFGLHTSTLPVGHVGGRAAVYGVEMSRAGLPARVVVSDRAARVELDDRAARVELGDRAASVKVSDFLRPG